MHYLWKDKKGIFYITNYKETNTEGLVKIDGRGFMEVELVFESILKSDLWSYVNKLAKNK